MTRIPPSSELLALLRQQAIDRQRPPTMPAGGKSEARQPPPRTEAQPDRWAEWIAQSIARIQRDDPDRRRKAFRAFLEASLARELGIDDPAGSEFTGLVDTVEEGMLGDPGIRTAIDRAGDLLLRSAIS